jgi:hypothetical protein
VARYTGHLGRMARLFLALALKRLWARLLRIDVL